ncbi:hypothetical protein SEA_CHASER_146 [Mycobacterium phage Chaser]|nr:hypothetical protein SEA_CHASER_146 [Mycobacterium phage Chaser]
MAYSDKYHGSLIRKAIASGKDVRYYFQPHNGDHGKDGFGPCPSECDAFWTVTIDGSPVVGGTLHNLARHPIDAATRDHMSTYRMDGE